MTPEIQKSQVIQDQLADLTQTLEKEKVQLTPEVEEYVRSHVRAVQNKLQAGQDVYENDLEFILKVKMWVLMPKEWRNKYTSIEDMETNEELKGATVSDVYETIKRDISIKQWMDLLHMTEVAEEKREWIDKTFLFPGNGKIETKGNFNLENCTGLTKLPEGLKVGGNLYLTNCTGLTKLPEGLSVGRNLDLTNCTGLTKLPKGLRVGFTLNLNRCTGLTELPEDLMVVLNLSLDGCTGLTELPNNLSVSELDLGHCASLIKLPENLSIFRHLFLGHCTKLKKLPDELSVAGNLYLSDDLDEQIIKDAERLKKEGRIRGKIFDYI